MYVCVYVCVSVAQWIGHTRVYIYTWVYMSKQKKKKRKKKKKKIVSEKKAWKGKKTENMTRWQFLLLTFAKLSLLIIPRSHAYPLYPHHSRSQIQTLGSLLAFGIRYGLASVVYEHVHWFLVVGKKEMDKDRNKEYICMYACICVCV